MLEEFLLEIFNGKNVGQMANYSFISYVIQSYVGGLSTENHLLLASLTYKKRMKYQLKIRESISKSFLIPYESKRHITLKKSHAQNVPSRIVNSVELRKGYNAVGKIISMLGILIAILHDISVATTKYEVNYWNTIQQKV